MYKFLCANITKPRNVSNTCQKLAQSQQLHQDISRPSTAPGQRRLSGERQHEENPDFEDENTPRPSTSPSRLERPSTRSQIPLPTFKTFREAPQLKMKDYPKFYTGHFIRIDPPTPSISKKYYHVYSFNGPSLKRSSGSFHVKKLTERDKDNYLSAMESLHKIERNKSDFQFKGTQRQSIAGTMGNEMYLKQYNKKKTSKGETGGSIRYPTHTIKHTLKLSKRYKIRQESAERRIRELEDKHSKKYQTQLFTPPAQPRKITYPTLVEHIKKGKFRIPMPEKKYLEDKGEEGPKVGTSNQDSVQDELERDFDALVKTHPTIENASKEVKMKLKTKFIQLLIKTARNPRYSPDKAVTESKQEKSELVPVVVGQEQCEAQEAYPEEPSPEKAVIIPEDSDNFIVSHPKKWTKPEATLENTYEVIYRYPRRVYVDESAKYDLDQVCMKESGTRIGSGVMPTELAKIESNPPPLTIYDTNQLSTLAKIENIETKNAVAIKQLNCGTEPGNNEAKIEQLKEERLLLLKELEKMSGKFNAMNQYREDNAAPEAKWRTENKDFGKGNSERLRKILMGQFDAVQNKPEEEDDAKWPWNKTKNSSDTAEASKEEEHMEEEENVRENEDLPEEADEVAEESGQKEDKVMLYQASPRFGEKSKVDELNEQARESEQVSRKNKLREENHRRRREIRERNEEKYIRKKYIPPRVDKVDDMMDEKVEIGEKVKEKIENLVPDRPTRPVHHPLRKCMTPAVKYESTTFEEKTKCDELQDMAEDLAKANTDLEPEENSGYAISQPEPKRIARTMLQNKENERKIEQDRKVKEDLEELYQRKHHEWGEAAIKFESSDAVKQDLKELCQRKQHEWGEAANKFETSAAVKQDLEELCQSKQHQWGEAANKFETSDAVKCQEVAEEVSTLQEVQEDSVAYSESPSQPPQKNKKDEKKDKDKTLEDKSKRDDHHDSQKRAEVERNALLKEDRPMRPLYPTGHTLEGDKDNSSKSLLTSKPEEKSLIIPGQCMQENFPQIKGFDYATDRESVAEQFFENYLEPAMMKVDTESILTKDNNNIEKPRKNKPIGAAVLQPRDEILIYEENRAPTKTDAIEVDNGPDKQAECTHLTMNILDKALNLRNELALSESKVLLDTKRQIDEMMEKIQNLEALLKKQEVGWPEEKRSENKIRMPTPQPPTDKDKVKDSKKEKPQDKNAMILPPKVQGSKPEKSAAEQNEATIEDKTLEEASLANPLSITVDTNETNDACEKPVEAKYAKLPSIKRALSEPAHKLKLTFQDIINPQRPGVKSTAPKSDNQNLLNKTTNSGLSKTLHSSVINMEKKKQTEGSPWSKSMSKLDKVNVMLENSKNELGKMDEGVKEAVNSTVELDSKVDSKLVDEDKPVNLITKIDKEPDVLNPRTLFRNIKQTADKKIKLEETQAATNMPEVDSLSKAGETAMEQEQLSTKNCQYFMRKSDLDGLTFHALGKPAVEREDIAPVVKYLNKPTLKKEVDMKMRQYFQHKIVLGNKSELSEEVDTSGKHFKNNPSAVGEKDQPVEMEHMPQYFQNKLGLGVNHKELTQEQATVKSLKDDVEIPGEHFTSTIQEFPKKIDPISKPKHVAESLEDNVAALNTLENEEYENNFEFTADALEKPVEVTLEDYVPPVDTLSKPAETYPDVDMKVRHYFQNKFAKPEVTLDSAAEEKVAQEDLNSKTSEYLKHQCESSAKSGMEFSSVENNVSTANTLINAAALALTQENVDTKMDQYFQNKLAEKIEENLTSELKRPLTPTDAMKKVIFSKKANVENKSVIEEVESEKPLEAKKRAGKPKVIMKPFKKTKISSVGPVREPLRTGMTNNTDSRAISCPGKGQSQAIQERKTQFSSWSTKSGHQIISMGKTLSLDGIVKKGVLTRRASGKSRDTEKSTNTKAPAKPEEETDKNYLESLNHFVEKDETLAMTREVEEDEEVMAITAKEELEEDLDEDQKPTVFWPEKNKKKEILQIKEPKVLELANEFQETIKSIPTVYYPSKEKKQARVTKQGAMLEMSRKRIIPKPKKVPKKEIVMPSKPKTCEADSNFYQNESLGMISFTLPAPELTKEGKLSLSNDGRRLTKAQVSKYASDSRLVSGGAVVPDGLKIEKHKKVSKAGISTTSVLYDQDRPKPNQKKIQKPAKEKSAIFRIMSNDEVLIIKKADEEEVSNVLKPKRSGSLSDQKKTVDHLIEQLINLKDDSVKLNATSKRELSTTIVASTGSTDQGYLGDLVFKNQKLTNINEVVARTITSTDVKLKQLQETAPASNKPKIEHIFKATPSKIKPKEKLTAKVEEFIEKPATREDGLKSKPPPSSSTIKSKVILKKHTCKPKPEVKKLSEQTIPKTRSESVVKTTVPKSAKSFKIEKEQRFPSYDTIKVDTNYSELLKKIEKNLRDKRTKLEVEDEKPEKRKSKMLEENQKNQDLQEKRVINESMRITHAHSELLKKIEKNLRDKRKTLEKQPVLANTDQKPEKTYTKMLKENKKNMLEAKSATIVEKIVNKPATAPVKSKQTEAHSMYTLSVPKLDHHRMEQTSKAKEYKFPSRPKSGASTVYKKISKENLQSEIKSWISNIRRKDTIRIWKQEQESLSKENLQAEIQCWSDGNNTKICARKSQKIGKRLKPQFVDAMRKHKKMEAARDKYIFDENENFMSVDKSTRKRKKIQKEGDEKELNFEHQEVPDQVMLGRENDPQQLDASDPPKSRGQLVEGMRERLNKSKKEESTMRKRKRIKKESIKEINEAAENMIKEKTERKWQELYKGEKRPQMYQDDAKVSKPQVGIAPPWGKSTNADVDKDKKHFHSDTKASSSSKVTKPPNKPESSANYPVRIKSPDSISHTTKIVASSKLNLDSLNTPKYTEMEVYKQQIGIEDTIKEKSETPRVTIKNIVKDTPLQVNFKPDKLSERIEEPQKPEKLAKSNFKQSSKDMSKLEPQEIGNSLESNFKQSSKDMSKLEPQTLGDLLESNFKQISKNMSKLEPQKPVNLLENNFKQSSKDMSKIEPQKPGNLLESNFKQSSKDMSKLESQKLEDLKNKFKQNTKDMSKLEPQKPGNQLEGNFKQSSKDMSKLEPQKPGNLLEGNFKQSSKDMFKLAPQKQEDLMKNNFKQSSKNMSKREPQKPGNLLESNIKQRSKDMSKRESQKPGNLLESNFKQSSKDMSKLEPQKVGDLLDSNFKDMSKKTALPKATKDSKADLYKRIDQELQQQKGVSTPDIAKIDPDVLNFKITKMVHMLAEDARFNEIKAIIKKVPEGRTEKSVILHKVVKKKPSVDPTIVSEPTTVDMKLSKRAIGLNLTNVSKNAGDVGQKTEDFTKKAAENNLGCKAHPDKITVKPVTVKAAPSAGSEVKTSNASVTKPGGSPKNFENDKFSVSKPPKPEKTTSEKLAKGLKSFNSQNMIIQKPTFQDSKTSKTSEKDEEAQATNGANFILKPGRTRKKKNNNQKLSYQIPIRHKSVRNKFMENTKFAIAELNPLLTTLDRKIGEDFSLVPKHVMENEERMLKARKRKCVKDLGRPNPLDKYKHLKITYIELPQLTLKLILYE